MRRLPAAAAALCALAAPAYGQAPPTQLISRPPAGGPPNGPSRGAAISQDRQFASLVAFSSQATNLVPFDGNGPVEDVFLVRRANPLADALRGLPWEPGGPPQLVSRGLDGAPANGPSYGADLDGDQVHDGLGGDGPHCVAFVSAASNLVRGDTNGQPDAFVADLRTGAIQRVSVDARGRQADGPTFEVQVDGGCDRVAFTADAPRLALTAGDWRKAHRRAAWRPLITREPRRGRRQVYVRVLKGGPTYLASAVGGRPGNGPSYDVSLADADALAYTSEASNLSVGDRGHTPDVYKTAGFAGSGESRRRSGTTTTLVSATRSGVAGDGPSMEPSISSTGRYVAFATDASDVLPCVRLDAGTVCDTNGVRDVAVADTRTRKLFWGSASSAVGVPGNGPSDEPSMTRYGAVAYASDATNLQRIPLSGGRESDRNGARDVFLWSLRTKNVSLQSRDSAGEPLPGPQPSSAPAVSAYNNYLLFESADPLADLTQPQPATRQVYLRYVGPR